MTRTSIIITTHNRPALLRRAVESARLAGKDVEVVVVDDASVDETGDVCRSMPGIRYVRVETQQRVAAARNVGLLAASGQYIAFLDDDDARLPGSIDAQLEVLDANPDAGLVYGRVHLGSQDLERTGRTFPESCPTGDVFFEIMGRDFIPTISVLFRRSALIAAGGLNTHVAPVEDWDLWVRIAEFHRVLAVDQPVAIWREPTLWSNQGSSRVAVQVLPQAKQRLNEHWARLPRAQANPGEFRKARKEFANTFCDRLLWEATEAARHGDLYAVRSVARAVKLSPSTVLRKLFEPRCWKKFWSMMLSGAQTERSGAGP